MPRPPKRKRGDHDPAVISSTQSRIAVDDGPEPSLADLGDADGPVEFDFAARVRTAPETAGVYIMRDRRGRVVYIGKARNLRARLRQYHQRQDERFFVHLLGEVLGEIELVRTASDKEALLLENELVKRHQPEFNVKLRDDKNFIHLRLGQEHAWPKLEVVRQPKDDGARYFGPFASAAAARATLRQVNGHFGLRPCRDTVFRNRSRPCLEYQIGRCPGMCVLPVDRAGYDVALRDAALLLGGRGGELLASLQERMAAAAAEEDFERAARLRDQWRAIERSLEKQHVALIEEERDIDVFGCYREGGRLAVALLRLERGRIVGARSFALPKAEFDDAEALADLIARLYDRGQAIPDLILLPLDLDGDEALADWLTELRHERGGPRRRVELLRPQRGERVRLLEMAAENARQAFDDRLRAGDRSEATVVGLQRKLGLHKLPRRIECFDNSNISGTDPVASMVVFRDGVPEKASYRRFRIRGMTQADDFATMYQVLSRRFGRALRDGSELPDLVVVDGGPGQLRMAVAALHDLGVEGVELVGLAKARTLDGDDRGASRRSPERVWKPEQAHPLILPQTSDEVLLLTHLRDEAHRFAITFHRETRSKRTLQSALDGIEGVGPARRAALLAAFPSVKAIRAADVEAIAAVPGIGRALAERIAASLQA